MNPIYNTQKDGTPYTVDKSSFPRGEWHGEHDRVEWRHNDLPCLMLRNPRSGVWCGYVGLSDGHPLHGKDFGDDACDALEAPGGITYSEECAGNICHNAHPGEPEHVWWLGFDCNHAWDVEPRDPVRYWNDSSYKREDWVKARTEELAEQLSALRAP